MMNIDSKVKEIVIRLAAVCAGADGIDDNGGSLPFETSALKELGKDYGLGEEDIVIQIEKAKEGLTSLVPEDWSSLESLDSDVKNAILDRLGSIAAADSDFSDPEKDTLAIIRSKIGA